MIFNFKEKKEKNEKVGKMINLFFVIFLSEKYNFYLINFIQNKL
jgi:hypothetical protein